jgi:glycerophosphoryl diester phosphodiesterase
MWKKTSLLIIASVIFALFCGAFSCGTLAACGAKPAANKRTMEHSVYTSSRGRIILIAHRGAPQGEPENSIAGYRSAVNHGAIFIEFDLVISRDGVVYISHDNNLRRTTGKDVVVSQADSKKLDRVKLRNGEKLPRLSEFFEEFGDSILYLAETKNVGKPQSHLLDKTLIFLIKQYHLENKVMLQSQSMDSLRTVHSAFGRMPIMYIAGSMSRSALMKKIRHLPRWVDAIGISQKAITKKAVETAHRRGVKVALYTVKDRRSMQRALRYDTDMICTDNVVMSYSYLLSKHWVPGREPLMREFIR